MFLVYFLNFIFQLPVSVELFILAIVFPVSKNSLLYTFPYSYHSVLILSVNYIK